jgi:chaperonin GroES
MTVRPMFDRILVQRNEEPTKTKSGLFLPEAAKEKPSEGTVLAVGQGRLGADGKVTPLVVKVGDRVMFEKYSGTEIKVDGEERIILREDDVLGIIG